MIGSADLPVVDDQGCDVADGETGDGGMLADQFHITGYPSLIVVSPDGKMIAIQTGFLPPDDLLAFGRQFSKR